MVPDYSKLPHTSQNFKLLEQLALTKPCAVGLTSFCACLLPPQFHEIITTLVWDCLYCDEECSNKEQRRVHIQQHYEGRPKWQIACIFCGLEFKKEYQLKVHKGRWCKAKP